MSHRGGRRLLKTHDPLHRLADSYLNRFADTFTASVERLRKRVTLGMVEADMALGLTNDPRRLLALVDGLEIAKAESTVFAELVTDAAVLTVGGETLREAMTVQSFFVQQAARDLTAKLVTRVSKETKAAIRQIVFEAIRDGDAPAVSRRLIRQTLGLTQRDAIAVKRVRASRLATANTPRQVGIAERGIEAYSRQLLNARAMNIARTETMFAGNAGRVLGWKQMAREGLIDGTRFRQRWLVTNDDRLCPRCAPMSGKLVALGGRFEENERGVLPSARVPVAGDTTEHPPLHPRCRCTLVADFAS